MPEIMSGPKSHDIEHHMSEDILAHGNPAGYDVNSTCYYLILFVLTCYSYKCSPGESKMRVMKLKNHYSNKGAPSTDIAKKVISNLAN